MGISIEQWRAVVGCFSQPARTKTRLKLLNIRYGAHLSLSIRLLMFALLTVAGVESNPGPATGTTGNRGRGAARGSGPPRGRGSGGGSGRVDYFANYPTSSQDTYSLRSRSQRMQEQPSRPPLSQASLNAWLRAPQQTQVEQEPPASGGESESDTDPNDLNVENLSNPSNITDLLLEIRSDVKRMNSKFDKLDKKVQDLKKDNKYLKQQNESLSQQVNVKPVACYGAEIWGYEFCEEIEKVQSRFCKYFIGLKQQTNDSFAIGECGRLPLVVCYTIKAIKYWIKLTQMANHRYPRQCYLMLKSLTEAGKTTWASHIKLLLFENGFGHAWMAGSVWDANAFISMYIRRIKDISLQNWRNSVNESSKADHYKHFKSQLDVEKYLTIELNFKARKTLANFRCASHTLHIEKGRHQDIDREYRFCPFCLERNVYTIEDELHFFMLCPMYDDLRNQYFKPSWKTNVCSQNFYSIMKTTDNQSLFCIAKFLVSRASVYGN